MLARYMNVVRAKTGSVREAARRLKVDRRALAARLDPELVERLMRQRKERDGG